MIGSAVKYFEGAFTPEYIKWEMSWYEFMMYMAAIPTYSDKPKVETKEASELF
jgi:hypothetical protein